MASGRKNLPLLAPPAGAATALAVALVAAGLSADLRPTSGAGRGSGIAAGSSLAAVASAGDAPPPLPPLPERLSETGLFAPDDPDRVAAGIVAYTPQYPLWTDGAAKRRWFRLPPGRAIDARDPDAWVFPTGTRLWKEFRFDRRVETRYMEVLEGGRLRYATYVWSEDGRDAWLLPAGDRAQVTLETGGVHDVPSESDCRVCHEGRRSGVLGVNALQLSPDRDPRAPHAQPPAEGDADLNALVARKLIADLPRELLQRPPRVKARSELERAALGYLFGNCSGCHNAEGPIASVGLDFDQRVSRSASSATAPLPSAIGRPSGFTVPGAAESLRIAPGRPESSAVVHRMSSRFAATQMPPLGTRLVDEEALELVRDWIATDLSQVSHGLGERQ